VSARDRKDVRPLPAGLPFGPETVSWRVAREPILGLASGPTLLLQVCHPLVAAGVRQYSDFEKDPWGRLWRTLDITLKIAFADPAVSVRQAQLLRKKHERVRGVSDEGVPYHAMDPKLLLWVWATLVFGALDTYERIFGRLSNAERERFYEEQKLLAHATGVPEGFYPSTFGEFRLYFDRMVRDELRATDVARTVVAVSRRPPLPWPLRPLAGYINDLTLGLLPPSLRDELTARSWDSAQERALTRLIAVVRAVSRIVPRRVRQLPTAYLIRRRQPLRLFQRFSGRDTRPPTRLAS
jgi:uncharacterized protein (DUF2236 family)